MSGEETIAPRFGYFRTFPLWAPCATDPLPAKRLYLALLPEGRFVRTLGPAEDFDFAGYACEVVGERSLEVVELSEGGWSHHNHLGEYCTEGLSVLFTSRMLVGRTEYVQRWSAGCVTPEILISRGEVYWRYESAHAR